MQKLRAFLYKHVDFERDRRGFSLRLWLGFVYAELYLDTPTGELSGRVLYRDV